MKYKLLKDSITNLAGDIFELGIPQAFKKHYVCNRNEKVLWANEVENNPEWFAPFLSTTEDGVDIYVGDTYFLISKCTKFIHKFTGIVALKPKEAFSTKQAALIYLAKQKYPAGTKVMCPVLNIIKSIVSHNTNTRLEHSENTVWFESEKGGFVMVYDDGKWAEIIHQVEVGKWYSVNNNDEFIKLSSYDKEAIYGEGITKKHLKFHNNWWIYFNHIKNYELLTDLSVIQPYLPDNHVDKIVNWKVGDFITTAHKVTMKLDKVYYVDSDLIGESPDCNEKLYLEYLKKATESEIIDYYEKLGWVKGAKFLNKNGDSRTLTQITVLNRKCIGDGVYVGIEGSSTYNYINECKLIKQPELPKSWKELGKITGFHIDSDSHIYGIRELSTINPENHNVYFTEKQAESALTFAQLSQLVAKYNDGWVADWNNVNQEKWLVRRRGKDLDIYLSMTIFHHLPFKSQELAELSLKHHNNLWKTYNEL